MKTYRVFAGLAAAMVLAAGTGAAATTLPDVREPASYDKPRPVRTAIERMQKTLADHAEDNWQAQRNAGICEDAARRLHDYVTSQAYTAELGEQLWRECHQAYTGVE
ncbi:hypothetical protein [Rhodovibrio salinarum]|uniref:UrcA family protein n=1 Tax=Rhodovibrio salinarum TaxID=1087 RepID=A0A934V1M4_9PROT|nr:hypothetical protein [Rhodovibrio salinarum]MBK1698680.1 hypothetical protein [Rhodovibrio salinarum]